MLLLAALSATAPMPAAAVNAASQLLCPVISPELAKKVAAAIKGAGQCATVCRGCGCKGGPGYKGPRGCVGWTDVISVCGPPPHARCERQCALIVPACVGKALGLVWLKALAAQAGLDVTFLPADHAPVFAPAR